MIVCDQPGIYLFIVKQLSNKDEWSTASQYPWWQIDEYQFQAKNLAVHCASILVSELKICAEELVEIR